MNQDLKAKQTSVPLVSAPLVGIAVLNYRHPSETLSCIRRLLEREPASSRIVWIENDAAVTRNDVVQLLNASELSWIELSPESPQLPPSGCIGVMFNEENLATPTMSFSTPR